MKKRKDFLVFGKPRIEPAEIEEVVDTLRSGWLGTGPKTAQFEEDFRQYKGADHAIAVSSCTAALHLSGIAAGIKRDDEVITTPLTFCATVNAIIHAGATPVLADVDPETMNIDPAEIRKKITSQTKALLPVHFAGRPCQMDMIMDIAKEYNLKVIEDCAHAIESTCKEKSTGIFGDFGCFSFYVTKNIITAEGGMVLTNNEESAARIKRLALHGMSRDAWKRFGDKGYIHYGVRELGFKNNMTDIQASIGIHQLKRISDYWQRRAQIWEKYNQAFSDLPVRLPPHTGANVKHAYHLYTILIDEKASGIERDDFLQEMFERNIGVGVHYLSIPEHSYYQKAYGFKPEDYPQAMRIGRQTVSLPLSAGLSDEDVRDVIAAVRDIFKR